MTALNLTVGDVGNRTDVRERTLQQLADIDQVIADNGSLFVKALGADTIVAAKREGRIAVVMGFQDTSMIGPDLDRLALYRGLGVRIVQLTYNLRNLSGDGALEPADAGLSKLGRATIARIEAEKLLLDLSHGGRRTTREAIAAATRPLVISHTGCRALKRQSAQHRRRHHPRPSRPRAAWSAFTGCRSWSRAGTRPARTWCGT